MKISPIYLSADFANLERDIDCLKKEARITYM